MTENISEVNFLNSVPLNEVMESLSISNLLNCGWARRQKQGKMYGAFITRLKDNIYGIF